MDIKEFFQDAVRKQASDIFLIPGMPLAMKINGRIEPVGEEKVFPAEMDNYIREIYAISGNRDMTRIQEQGDDDFSFSIVGLSRFRASVMKQRGSLAAVIRIVRFDLPNPADIHIPETVLNIASMKKGNRSGGKRKIHNSGLRHRPDQPDQERPCHHAGRSHRISAPPPEICRHPA